ncbi:hypothetical protein PIB30_009977 [Stylosanthes scabra]|uniref:Uncharacterized protein n=1 Tax=Stylosanthes scabra TaxID=79078 RepID=A0ABU6U4N8_9FABA|nr:hypothetical protein [Stylosanthes scabra]
MTPEVASLADPDIWRVEHMSLWTSVCAIIYFGSIEWYQVDRVIPHFGGVQNYPHHPLNIDFLHARDSSNVPLTPQHHFDTSTPMFESPSQDFLVGLNNPGFQRTLQQIFLDDTVYRTGFVGS